jgi:hypothetical protein
VDLTVEELAEAQALRPDKKRFQKVRLTSGWIWLCNPTRPSYKRFESVVASDAKAQVAGAVEQLIIDCLVKPDLVTFQAWLDDMPAQLSSNEEISPALGVLTGATAKT